MLHLGSKAPETREMILDDIFFSRLKLLLRMTSDYFEGRDFSDLRCQIVADNARYIQSESIELGSITQAERTEPAAQSGIFIDHCFYRCVHDLAVLMERVAKRELLDDRRREALQEKFQIIRHIQKKTCYEDLFAGYLN